MKYVKIIDGRKVIKSSGQIILHKDGNQIFNPKPELLIEDGWEEYIEEDLSFSEENEFEKTKDSLIRDIQLYDKSNEVEIFYINDIPLWLDREERSTLQRRFEIELKNGITETTLWKDGVKFQFSISNGIEMLNQIELYAIKCFDTTQTHLSIVRELQTIEELNSYNYLIGYPEKIRLSIV